MSASLAFISFLSIFEDISKLPTAPLNSFGFGWGSSFTFIFKAFDETISSLKLYVLKKFANGSLLFLWFDVLILQVICIGSISSFPDFWAVSTVLFIIAVL